MEVKRYDLELYHGNGGEMVDSANGAFVDSGDFDAMEARAEAAEATIAEQDELILSYQETIRNQTAKLAELEKQEPIARVVSVLRGLQRVKEVAWQGGLSQPAGTKLFTRPAPAINLAELVPVYQQHFYGNWHDCDKGEYDCAEEGSRRVLYMRNNEEQSK